jgi:hypothetical protein
VTLLFPALVEVRLFWVSTGDPWAGPLCDVLLLPLARDDGLPLAQGETAERPVRDPPGAVLDGAGLALCAWPLAPVASREAGVSACDRLAAKNAVAASAATTIPVLMRDLRPASDLSAALTSAIDLRLPRQRRAGREMRTVLPAAFPNRASPRRDPSSPMP